MTTFCDIARPSDINDVDTSFRIKKTSASGHTRIRPRGRQLKKKFLLKWGKMQTADKTTLQAFFKDNFAQAFDWPHPDTGVVYTVCFVDDELNFQSSQRSRGFWSIQLTLGEI